MSFENEVARLKAISDPAARARAAADVARDASTVFRAIELASMHDLVNAHGGLAQRGSVAAAARELGREPEAVRKRVTNTGAEESEPFEQEGEPARYFPSGQDAYDALLDWQTQRQDLTYRRDPLVRGALAAKLAPRVVRDITGLPLDTISRLESTSAGTAVNVPMRVWEETVGYLAELAPQLGRYERFARLAARALAGVIALPVDRAGHQLPVPDTLRGPEFEALSPEEKTDRLMNTAPPEGAEIPEAAHEDVLDGPDGWAAAFCATSEAAAGSQDADMAAANRRVAAVIRHVRVTGALPEGEPRG
ncbi:hypothetical protein PUR49_32450 [Streptomyces sp. BE147]|uniref:hypothetical protein n=1 Tax=Streptomyces sp. BE147 TaxID=3002524 RepID=UPI002E784E4F|nr:hypothetical protein [Streptomyces sp. BE147]MEE1741184.1 hypothetical protein [Streptomyces sp. BE147]